MNLRFLALAVASLFVITSVPGGHALHGVEETLPPEPPVLFTGQVDNVTGTVQLSWQAPDNATDYVYRIYRNGVPVNETPELNFTDTPEPGLGVNTYWATTVLVDSLVPGESKPSQTYEAPEDEDEDGWPLICEPVIIVINTDLDPPLSYAIDDACIPDGPPARSIYEELVDVLPVELK